MTTHSLKAEASVCNPYVVKFIVALGAMVSMILTVQLTTSFMAPDGGILALAVGGAFGLLLDISKVLFLIVGLTLRMRATTEAKKTAAGVLITFALILAATSVAATLSATLRADSGAHRTAVRESLEFKNLEAEREGIALDIAILRENARRDTQAGYRSRAKETLAQVKDLGVRYAFIGSSIQQMLEQGPGMKPSAVVLALASAISTSPTQETRLQRFIYLALHLGGAVLLELCLMACLALSLWMQASSASIPPESPRPPLRTPAKRERRPREKGTDANEEEPMTEMLPDEGMLHRARIQVQSGGLKPTVAALKGAFGVGQRIATEIRDHLISEGVIAKRGRSYGVVSGGAA